MNKFFDLNESFPNFYHQKNVKSGQKLNDM